MKKRKPIYLFKLLPPHERMRLLRLSLEGMTIHVLDKEKKNLTLMVFNRAVQIAEHYDVKLRLYEGKISCYDTGSATIKLCRYADPKHIIQAFCHEMAHALQYMLYGKDELKYAHKRTTADGWKFEQEADRFSYYVYKHYFSDIMKIYPGSFIGYRTKKDRKFLNDWYKGRR